jgi:hypothetical protein
MIEKLDNLVDDICGLNSKLVLLTGSPQAGKSELLRHLSARRLTKVCHVGAVFGQRLLSIPSTRRHLQAADLLRDLANEYSSHGLLLMDNIELLFDRTLRLSPVDLLKRLSHARCVVAAWPGEQSGDRLIYASTGHPEHQDCGIDGLVPFAVH